MIVFKVMGLDGIIQGKLWIEQKRVKGRVRFQKLGRGRGGFKYEGGRVIMEVRRKWRMKYFRS